MTKKLLFTLLSIFLSVMTVVGQVTQSVNVSQPGGLSAAIGTNLKTVTDLTLTGTINATDFQTIKQMTALKNLDMSKVSVIDNTIPAGAFQNRVLNSLMLPEGVVTIGGYAFQRATIDKGLILPSSVKKLGALTFANSSTQIDFSQLANSLETLGYQFVSEYTGSQELDFSNFKKLINFENRPYYSIGTFANYSGHVILPENLETLPEYTFTHFTGTVDLPQSLKTLGAFCFTQAKMSKLILPEGLETIGSSSFSGSTIESGIKLPSTIKTIKELAFSSSSTRVDFSQSANSLERLGYQFVSDYTGSTELDFSKFQKLINFENRPYYTIGTFAYYSGHVILPENLETLPEYTFTHFTGTVDLPQSLKTLGAFCFTQAKMSKLILPEGLETIGSSSFSGSTIESGIKLPSTIKTIKELAFSSSSTRVDFSQSANSLERLGYQFVSDYTGSTELDFSKFQKLINFENRPYYTIGTFANYSGHVILPENLETLPEYTFTHFTGTVDLPQSLKTIENNTFQESTITSIELPSSVTSIGNNAFYNAIQLEKIISNNPTPPALGSNVFAGVNKETTVLEVPKESVNLYGTADQWKDFLNVEAVLPSEMDVKYTHDNVNFTDYHAIRVGEYYWIDKNFHHEAPGAQIYNPVTQAKLDKYMPYAYLDPANYQVNIDDFNYYYGIYYDKMSSSYMQKNGKILINGEVSEGWGFPEASDVYQLAGMAPSFLEPYVNGNTVAVGLGSSVGSNSLAYDFEGIVPGAKVYWFRMGNNAYNFKLMPAGRRLQAEDIWTNSLIDPYNGTKNHEGVAGDMEHLFYTAGFRLSNGNMVYIHDLINEDGSYHWVTGRFMRRLTDEELGYKLYKNDAKEDIVRLGLTDIPPAGYTELEHGYLRGYYVKYIINGENPNMTPADLYYKFKNYTNVDVPPRNLETRSLSADDVVIPFRTSSEVRIYPNPVQDVLNVSGEGVEKISLYDLSGRQLQSVSNASSIQMSGLTAGTYIVRVQAASGESVHKVMKK